MPHSRKPSLHDIRAHMHDHAKQVRIPSHIRATLDRIASGRPSPEDMQQVRFADLAITKSQDLVVTDQPRKHIRFADDVTDGPKRSDEERRVSRLPGTPYNMNSGPICENKEGAHYKCTCPCYCSFGLDLNDFAFHGVVYGEDGEKQSSPQSGEADRPITFNDVIEIIESNIDWELVEPSREDADGWEDAGEDVGHLRERETEYTQWLDAERKKFGLPALKDSKAGSE